MSGWPPAFFAALGTVLPPAPWFVLLPRRFHRPGHFRRSPGLHANLGAAHCGPPRVATIHEAVRRIPARVRFCPLRLLVSQPPFIEIVLSGDLMAQFYLLLFFRRRICWLPASLIFGWLTALGQPTQPPTAQGNSLIPPHFIPTSPTVTEFPRYDKQSLVQLHTGGAQYSVPLATSKSRSLRLPISLAYYFNGLQVYQPRALVGLGWTLQAGTSVSLHVRGKLDRVAVGPDYRYDPDSMLLATQSYLNRVGANEADSGPDLYAYSLPGGPSGCFMLRDTAAILLPKQPVHVRLLHSIAEGFQITGAHQKVWGQSGYTV